MRVPGVLFAIVVVCALAGAVVWFIDLGNRDSERWSLYATEHHCVPVSQSQDLIMFPIVCGDGCMSMVPMFVPRTTYRCDGDEYRTR